MVGSTPALGFQRVADPTPGKNRVHIDGCWVPLNSAVMRHRDSFGPLCRIQKATSFTWVAPKRNYTLNLNSTGFKCSATFRPQYRLQFRITISCMKTINGKPISEEQIDAWVAEAEEGYDVEMLRKRGRKPRDEEAAQVVSIRLSPSEVLHLDQYAVSHGLSRSQAIRKALKDAI